MILLLSLFSPLVEIFPNLYMSWWIPTNGEIEKYLQLKYRRILVVSVVWLPILYSLNLITEAKLIILLGGLIFSAFGLRLYLFDKLVQKRLKVGDNNIDETTKLPEFLYLIAFSIIGYILYDHNQNYPWLVIIAIILLLFGAFLMSHFRSGNNKNLIIDILGRLIFTTGFIINLLNVYYVVYF